MLNIMLSRNLVPHFVPSCGLITTSQNFIKIALKSSYYASIMLDAFRDLLCSKLCWHNRSGPIQEVESGLDNPDNLCHLGHFLMSQTGVIHKLN